MKKILAVLLIVTMLIPFASIGSFAASDAYKATWTLKTSVYNAASSEEADAENFEKGGNTVYDSTKTANVEVKAGQVVWVTIHLKTGSSYYAGDMQNKIYYSNSIFKSANENNFFFNDAGKYNKVCNTRMGAVYTELTKEAKKNGYPSSWSNSKKKANEFYSLIMIPKPGKTAPANVDEDLVSFPIYVKSDAKTGSTGEIFISQDDLRTSKNKTGMFFLSYYEKGDTTKASVAISDQINHDTSKAKITYTVVAGGSQPQQGGGLSFWQKLVNFFVSIWNFIVGLFK